MTGRGVRYKGGSVVSFVIIAVAIAAVVGVGLYALRQRAEHANTQSIAANQEMPPTLPGSQDDTKTDSRSETFPSSSKESTSSSSSSSGTDKNSSSSPSSTSTLPSTGPEQLLVIPILAVVVYIVVAYAGSTRQLSRLRS